MTRKKLTIFGIIAAAVLFTIAATAMAAPDAASETETEAMASSEITCEETICEVDSETGEIRMDGEVVYTIDPDKLDALADGFIMSMEGPDGEITISPADGELASYEIISSSENGDHSEGVFRWSDAAAE